jgi:hypothetical protein
MADARMTDTDRLTAERIRALAVEYRHRAALHASLGHAQEESNCRALADLHEERARVLERHAMAPLSGPASSPG